MTDEELRAMATRQAAESAARHYAQMRAAAGDLAGLARLAPEIEAAKLLPPEQQPKIIGVSREPLFPQPRTTTSKQFRKTLMFEGVKSRDLSEPYGEVSLASPSVWTRFLMWLLRKTS